MKNVIYETKGRAREFCQLALNHYAGCAHGCIYCYASDVLKKDRELFIAQPRPRVDILEVERSANAYALKHEQRPILLSFVCDPYQPIEEMLGLTRRILEIFKNPLYNLRFSILTKAGKLAQRDFDLYRHGDAFATTLTCDNPEDSLKWEPGAALPADRIANLREAHERHIETWVSLEPVIYPDQTLHLIDLTHEFVGHYRVGNLNYHPHAKTIDWPKFCRQVIRKLNLLQCKYYIKKDLAVTIGEVVGFWNED